MPKSKRSLQPVTGDNPALFSPQHVADRLYRAAAECLRQRQRYAGLVAAASHDEEQMEALKVACMCDQLLQTANENFERMATGEGSNHRDEEWYRKGTVLWQASREYERRHNACDLRTKRLGAHTPAQLQQLALEYDLEASALLALQHAITAYRKAVPSAHIDILMRSKVA